MAYTINQGFREERGLDRLQRALLIGLPVLALILSLGAIRHHGSNSNPAGQKAKLIPIVSSLSSGSDKSGSTDNNGSSNPSNSGGSGAIGGSQTSGALTSTSGSPVASTSTTPIVGGRGGGPTGGTTGGGTTTSPLPNCSLNQIATVTCMVPACSPAVTLAPGQKAILGITGTCVIVN